MRREPPRGLTSPQICDNRPVPDPQAVTRLLPRARAGDPEAVDRLLSLVYDDLKAVAGRAMRRERPGHTLQTTGLVHEAYLRLFQGSLPAIEDRAHLLGIAARAMRQILVEHARAHHALKRGEGRDAVPLDEARVGFEPPSADVLALDEALERLARLDHRQARIVELRHFGGLGVEEVAEALGISPATVKREWAVARAWLYRELTGVKEQS